MAIHVALSHKTRYRYDRLVAMSPHVIRLRPAPHTRTPILSYAMRVTPAEHFINWQQDPHGNYLARVVFPEKTRDLVIEIDLVAEMAVFNPFDFFLEPSAEQVPFDYDALLRKDLAPYLEVQPAGPLLTQFLATIDRTPQRSIDFIVELNRRLSQDIRYIIRLAPGVQTSEETLAELRGSCRDTGWLLVEAARHLGLAARFVSGYLIQLTPDVKALDGPVGAAVDFTDLHAWAEIYLPGAGWVGLDPTSGLLAGEGHIPLAATPDPFGAAPVSGAVDEAEVAFEHEMHVRRVQESPRVTKPYTDDQWDAIVALGRRIDSAITGGDIRLTMGGEPTFVSIDDMDGPEWNTVAQGPRKRELAGELVRRLKDRFAPGGLLHVGQGKWYPGESLPRWAFGCWWRRDGAPIWHDDGLAGDERVNYGFDREQAHRFVTELARRLEVNPDHAEAAYEDAWYYLWKERRLPVNVDPLRSELNNPEERARLARIFDQGLDHVVGYVLPVTRDTDGAAPRWRSERWFLRADHLFLIPGDSPIGYRLPIEALPWVAPEHYPYLYEADPFAPQEPPLPSAQEATIVMQRAGVATGGVDRPLDRGDAGRARTDDGVHWGDAGHAAVPEHPPVPGESAPGVVRTALCVEPRHGRIYVFMPPARNARDYLDLITAVEQTAATLQMPVIVEGTPPPGDPRLNHLSVTPDPGVIEVNLQPAHSWDELVHNTTTLYDEARLTRLGTEKFMLDGRHTGTGGGNHIVIGGPTPADSPLLRRPDLLRSLVAYWNNHPSLSFLFSGLFIGPTSQHPRVDEARNDSLHELELALTQIPDGAGAPPWLIDRVLRNVLIDVTGNTHRAEFCIDKLYAPDTSSGRQGLLELRAFEMPPHARMSLTQQLLLRALIAAFWRRPYDKPLARWGTELHDRFMLPHFVAQDFDDVLAELAQHGYPVQPDWFAAHLEFRFPRYGAIAQRGVDLEIRQALEPWHVLGEDAGAGGAVRYVDSTVERLQVKVRGLVSARHVVACNGRRVPLQPTGTAGEFVAGVRYRAWEAPNSLHPTVPVHAPLVFDLLDQWNERAIGGCIYHVAHPGGRSFETFPVNAYEAESRRLSRFSGGHTPGAMAAPPEERNPDFPFTLDLRRPPRHGVESSVRGTV